MENASPDLPCLPPRQPDSHKGDFGHLFLVGGSVGMAGSISMSGMAALRTGAGLVTIATPRDCLDTVAGFCPSYMTLALPCDAAGMMTVEAYGKLQERAGKADVFACGPGAGSSRGVADTVLKMQREIERPIVFDADALNALAKEPEALATPAGPRVLTPHPGEFARLLGVERFAVEQRRELAIEQATRWRAVVVLKGRHTIVTDGQRVYENQSGNAGLATAGTGDVLTGVIASFLGQGLAPFEAAQLATYVHGIAGEMAAEVYGELGMISDDLIGLLPEACRTVIAD